MAKKHKTFVGYVQDGQKRAAECGESCPAVKGIADGLLRLTELSQKEPPARPCRRSHRSVERLLEESQESLKCYRDFCVALAVDREVLTVDTWYGRWRHAVRSIGESLGCVDFTGEPVAAFLDWPGE